MSLNVLNMEQVKNMEGVVKYFFCVAALRSYIWDQNGKVQ